MDGKALQIDDKVYDLLYGNGEVLSVSNGGAVVKFQRMSQSYDADGNNLHWKLKTLFWHEPIIITVPNDMKHYTFLREAVTSVAAVVNSTWENFSK